MINFQVHIHGLSGYLAGVSIAVKQVMPDHVLARSVGKQFSQEIDTWNVSELPWARSPIDTFLSLYLGSLSSFGPWERSRVPIAQCSELDLSCPGFTLGSIRSLLKMRAWHWFWDLRCTATVQRGTWLTALPSPHFSQMFFSPLLPSYRIPYFCSWSGTTNTQPCHMLHTCRLPNKGYLKTLICFRCKVCRKPVRRWVPVSWNIIFFIHCNMA